MDKKPSNDYTQGQMMGMLCIVRLLRINAEAGTVIPDAIFDNIERLSVDSLAEYLQTPQEDVFLLVDNQLEKL